MRERLRRLFAPSIFEDEEKTRAAQTLNSIGWVAIGVVLLITISRFITQGGQNDTSKYVLPFVILVLIITQILLKSGYVRGAGIFLVSLVWVAMTYQAYRSDGVRDIAILVYSILVPLAALLLGWHAGFMTGVISVIAIWLFAYQEYIGARTYTAQETLAYARDLTAVFIVSSVLTYYLIQRLNRSLSDARLELRERLRADEKLQLQARYLTALHETTFGLLNRLELNPLLESILARVSELLDTPHVGIDLVSKDGIFLRQEVGAGIFQTMNGASTRKGEGLTGQVWASGKTIFIKDYESWEGKNPQASGLGFYAIAGTPLKSKNRIFGVLIVAHTDHEHNFTPEQEGLLEKLSALASLAIDNARLYEAVQKELKERKVIEQDMRSSEERFRKVFNNGNIAITIVTLEDGIFLEANEAFWNLSGLDPEKALGRSVMEFNFWNGKTAREKFIKDLLENGSLQDVEVEFRKDEAQSRASLAYYELINIRDQRCILCMFYDISEQRRIQRELKESEERNRAIISSIPDMIFEVSANGTLLDFMASAELTPVMEPHEFIGKNIKDLFPPEIAKQTLFALERALNTGQVHAFEYGMPPGEEIQFFEARVAAVTPESAIIMVRDISQRKWVETEREKLITELEEKNSELERFTYTVSHDLKSPVITIRGFLGFLEKDAVSGNLPRLQGDIKRISDATDKMQTLLNELLDLSRVGRLVNPPVMVPFNAIVNNALDLVQGRIHANNVQVRIQENMDNVYVDSPRMVEALQNLIDNAAKFVSDTPVIEIGQAGKEGNMPVFFVRDNGIGIEPIHHDRIFGLFNKLDATSEGTGVGLALVRRIIEVHKGRIWVQSEPEKGATFFFTLPSGPEA